jgi:endoglucanase
MGYLHPLLIIIFIVSLLFNYLYYISKKKPIDIVNDMGIGYNLGNLFDSYSATEEIKTPDEQITLWGNSVPTKKLFNYLKKSGFKTIRFPITWMHFMDESGKVNPLWMSRVKEVVKLIIDAHLYCILNIHNDAIPGNWLSEGIASKNKYKYLWEQIANEFKDFDDEYLLFEALNVGDFKIDDNYDYKTLYNLSQTFVDSVRNSGGKNKERLLVLSGANKDIDLTCSPNYIMPKDPSKKLAISVHYYSPPTFTLESDKNPWTFTIDSVVYEIPPLTKWGDEGHYNDMINYFENLKKNYADKGIPVIITEIGVLTEELKDIKSIRNYLNALFSLSSEYKGFMACLWDTSNRNIGNMNYIDRNTNLWYDEKIRNNFKKISKGKNVKITDYFIYSYSKTISSADTNGNMSINIGNKKVMKVIFNVFINTSNYSKIILALCGNDKYGAWKGEPFTLGDAKKQYDGSHTFTIDIKDKDYYDFVQIDVWDGKEFITFNYFTVEFNETEISINYEAYMSALINNNQ